MPDASGKRSNWIRLSGLGFEFGSAVIGFTLVGYWIGDYYGSTNAGVLIGAGLGIVGGGYNLIRRSLTEVKRAAQDQQARGDGHDSDRQA